jgi:hypothetical protein
MEMSAATRLAIYETLAHDDMLSAGEGLFPMLASAIEQAPQG